MLCRQDRQYIISLVVAVICKMVSDISYIFYRKKDHIMYYLCLSVSLSGTCSYTNAIESTLHTYMYNFGKKKSKMEENRLIVSLQMHRQGRFECFFFFAKSYSGGRYSVLYIVCCTDSLGYKHNANATKQKALILSIPTHVDKKNLHGLVQILKTLKYVKQLFQARLAQWNPENKESWDIQLT